MDNIERFENDTYIPDQSTLKHIMKNDHFSSQASFTPSMPSNISNKYEDKYADPNKTANGNLGSYQANDATEAQTGINGNLLPTEHFVGDASTNVEDNGLSCFVKDRLTSSDLLPKDADNSRWAQINPSGSGMLGDQNFLTAGYHVGINTIGQSLRNANLQLRSEPPNPQVAVSPWGISTIEPDVRAVAFEIGSAPSF